MLGTLAFLNRALALVTIGLLGQAAVSAATLYDGSLGTTPNAQGWFYVPDNGTLLVPPVSVGMSAATGGTLLQTLSPNSDRAGFFRSDQPLDRTTGYTLSFNVRLDGEAHDTLDRSGFSVIALSSDKKGIELSFWPTEIFAKESDIPFFTHAEARLTNTTNLNQYFLTIQSNSYSLTGASLSSPLTGALRDYSANSFYNTANFLFLGDNTTSAGADIFLGNVTLQAIPEPGTWALAALLLLGAGVVRMRRA